MAEEEKDEAEEMAEDIPDFPEQKPKYQIWALGYDKDMNVTDYEQFISEWPDPDEAVSAAVDLDVEVLAQKLAVPKEVSYVMLQVETVVEVDGEEQNVGTVYEATAKVLGKE